MTRLEIHPPWRDFLAEQDLTTFEKLWSAPAVLFKRKKDREILRLEVGGQTFFLKRYFRFPFWGLTESGAEREWWAARVLSAEGFAVPEPVAFGMNAERRRRRALTLFKEVSGSRLEDIFREDPSASFLLLEPLVETLARFHALGFSHQDLYLCHLFWDGERLIMIDLQRIRRSRKLKPYWVIKDLAELFYSAREILGVVAKEFEEAFLKAYYLRHPWLSSPKRLNKLEKKIARIAAHDAKLKARRRNEGL